MELFRKDSVMECTIRSVSLMSFRLFDNAPYDTIELQTVVRI